MNKTMMLPALDQGFEIIGNIPKNKIAGYALLQLLSICMNTAALKVARIDWRKTDTVTAGMLRQALKLIIPRSGIRRCWNQYDQKLELISDNQHERTLSSAPKAA